jgi:CDP-glycerol glycerophosphotransferase (TagB/SpsB family)
MNRKIVITTPVPELRSSVYKMIAIRTFRRKPYEYFSYSHEEYIKQNKFFLTFLNQLEAQNKVVIIDVARQLLGNNNYKIVSDSHPLYSDNNHLSSSGSTLTANAFENVFKNIK